MSDIPTQPLTGKALIQKVESLGITSKRELARRCGYVTKTKSGKTRVNLNQFLAAIIQANGVALTPDTPRDRRGREPAFRVSVHKNGQIIIGSAYTQQMGLKPGDEFEIKLGYKHIQLKYTGNNNGHAAAANTEEQEK
ncbi:MAG: AbrB family transcriptional regulator [Thermostichales cyanobacterium BF4_bins_65]